MDHSNTSFDFGLSPLTIHSSNVERLKAAPFHQVTPPTPPPSSAAESPKGARNSQVRRKPLPSSTPSSPPTVAIRFSSGGEVVAIGEEESEPFAGETTGQSIAATSQRTSHYASSNLVVRDLDQFPRGVLPVIPQSPGLTTFADLSPDKARQVLQNLEIDSSTASSPPFSHARMVSDPVQQHLNIRSQPGIQRSITMPVRAGGPAPPKIDTLQQQPFRNDSSSGTPATKPGLAVASITSFFGWKGASSPVAHSPTTTISDRSSPGVSPYGKPPANLKAIPRAIDIPKANGLQGGYFAFPQDPPTPAMSIKMEELEEELREITTELASSIRREMELEDQVERLQLEGPGVEANRRTSDYFSDSGTSSVRYPGSDGETSTKLKRRSEQEKAQLKLDVSTQIQEERGRRKAMEAHIRSLEEHIQNIETRGPAGSSGRIQELESALDDNRRRLQEERQHKENFEDLLDALRGDLLQHKNERDNLRDEVVPQLRARVEGLEAEATMFQKLTYENARMQQELQALRLGRGVIDSIPEEAGTARSVFGLGRASSLSRAMGGLSRSNSLAAKDRESRESLADRVKDIEMQRDSLHRALKSLLDRQKFQNKEHEKRTKALEMERDRALEAQSPRRRGYEIEVKELRFEINQLRTRADDALEQKWRCEKGLGGLKKDLDRAEQETSSLRNLLHENEIPIPGTSGIRADTHATSASLERAYKELKAAQALSLSRLKELKGVDPSRLDDRKTEETMSILLQTMSSAEAERDFAQKQADAYRAQAVSLRETTSFTEGENAGLADQLHASAKRVDGLAAQVRYQLDCNADLRTRLSEAVGKGEREQKTSAVRIIHLQGKLKAAEDGLMAAQQHSEEAVQEREDDIRTIRDSNNTQLQRFKSSPTGFLQLPGARSPNIPQGFVSAPRSPRLSKTSSGMGMSMNEAMRTEALETRVRELENALREAEDEMEKVVQRMNQAQIEVMELQTARDDAMRSTRTLQTQIVAESEKYGSIMRYLPGGP